MGTTPGVAWVRTPQARRIPLSIHWRLARSRLPTYKAYSIAWFIVWAGVLGVVEAVDPPHTVHITLLVFLGWTIGWLAATIARSIYPPPGAKLN
jgi:hypothetical protein